MKQETNAPQQETGQERNMARQPMKYVQAGNGILPGN